MIDEPTFVLRRLATIRRLPRPPGPGRAAASPATRPACGFPPRLEIDPLTIRRPTGCDDERPSAH
jgi:hypothetical protein